MLYAFALLAMAASSLAKNLTPTAEEAAVALAAQAENVLLAMPPPLCVDTANGAKGYYTDGYTFFLEVD